MSILQIYCRFILQIISFEEQIENLKTAIDAISTLTLTARGSTLVVRFWRLKSINAL